MRKFDGHHLTLTQRMEIEQGLKEGKSYAEIARIINKNPGTISREVARNAKRMDITDSTRVPCANRLGCHMRNLCNYQCEVLCKMCGKWGVRCSDYCSRYVPIECQQLLKPPHVCNGCKKRSYCMIQKVIYSAKHADDRYREQLSSCREGINQTPESIQRLDSLVSPLLMKGQSLSHIYATHAEEIGCSRRTLYAYIDQSVLTARNIDLRRRVSTNPAENRPAALPQTASTGMAEAGMIFRKCSGNRLTLVLCKWIRLKVEKAGRFSLLCFF